MCSAFILVNLSSETQHIKFNKRNHNLKGTGKSLHWTIRPLNVYGRNTVSHKYDLRS